MFTGEEVALVTGASRGIGKAVALDLASYGVKVMVHYHSKEEEALQVADQIERAGGTAKIFQANVADEAAVQRMCREIKKEYGRLDILVNNAGITKDGFVTMMSAAKWQDVIDTNLKGTFFCTREALKIMHRQKRGAIINVASTSGVVGQPGQLNYSASKGGLIAFTKGLAREVAPQGIRANVVAPGFTETDMTRQMEPDVLKKYLEMVPLGRIGKPEEIAYMVSFLASSKAAYITGKVFIVDGGLVTV
ncbi:3-oxoacyl-[acyl-carrier-protein] reductase [Thermosporothrix hazakensis]|jgi:3-oxoacyl-[acyl-carrier protein] reductase|uniref:3-oxoacyl-[acyl-carrier-protein] reductase n=2 Tax=Thermosporothrix TaxID=768650 RepID=A0A326U0A4_THEHA|nr:3-oxoacyl-[acyl-carrier-protein] reductase [Thermosporothrix hazakensis]PZW22842.1 3-oxoacyl-[acyl-carrier-protein] reductase [Thermosporothrix hazakensis]BBH91667.1 beta-ketoacyl-ACP reductase [Thermosporothrix sp. COM3]GCE49809.1 beta-ketoacyl-ACP reductase [Thermosporothrix hazakensis]